MPPRVTHSSVPPRGSAHVPLVSSEHMPPSAAVTVCLPCLTHGSSPQPRRDPHRHAFPHHPDLHHNPKLPSQHSRQPTLLSRVSDLLSPKDKHTTMRRPRTMCHTNYHALVLSQGQHWEGSHWVNIWARHGRRQNQKSMGLTPRNTQVHRTAPSSLGTTSHTRLVNSAWSLKSQLVHHRNHISSVQYLCVARGSLLDSVDTNHHAWHRKLCWP